MNLPDNSEVKDVKLEVKDIKYIGEGAQGTVYRIDASRCVKIYKDIKYLPLELSNLEKAQKKTDIFPKVYHSEENFIIREYIEGTGLKKYLRNHPLTVSISYQLVKLIKTFKKIGFTRLDTRLDNVIITPEGRLRPIDPTSSMRCKKSYPQIMLRQLKSLGLKKRFLKHVKIIDKKLYKKWGSKS